MRLDAQEHALERPLKVLRQEGLRLHGILEDRPVDSQAVGVDRRDMVGGVVDEDHLMPGADEGGAEGAADGAGAPDHDRGGSCPGSFEKRAGLLHRDVPDRLHVLVRPLVVAAEIAVAEIGFARRLGRMTRMRARSIIGFCWVGECHARQGASRGNSPSRRRARRRGRSPAPWRRSWAHSTSCGI